MEGKALTRELTMDKLIELFLRKWYMIIISAVLFGLVTFIYSSSILEYRYTSSGTMIVTNKKSEQGVVSKSDLDTSARLVETYRILLTSTKFCEKIAVELDNKYSASLIKSSLSLKSVNNTEVLSVKATTSNKEFSKELVQCVLDNAQGEIDSVSEVYYVKILDNASEASTRSYPNVSYNTFIGVLAGVILSVVCGIVSTMFDTKVKDEEELKFVYNLPSLGAIPNMEDNRRTTGYGDGGNENENR